MHGRICRAVKGPMQASGVSGQGNGAENAGLLIAVVHDFGEPSGDGGAEIRPEGAQRARQQSLGGV